MTEGWRGTVIISGFRLSIAACVWSGFEPLAAVICLSGYAILYLLAVWIFAAPWVTYLAAAALAGACYFGTTLVPGITLADQALAAALLGFAFWAARVELRRRHAAPAYHVPWLQAALALTGAAMCAASWHLVSVGVGSWTGAGAFVVIAALAFLLNRERPRAIWAHLALLSFVEFTICGLGLAMGVQNLAAHHYGLLFMADGLTMLAAAEVLRFWLNRSEPQTAADQTGGVVNSRWAGTILAAIPRSAIVLTFVADWMGLLSIERTWLAGLVFLLGSASLLWVTRLDRRQTLVYLGLAQLVAGTLDLSSCAAGWNNPAMLAGWLALTGALLGLALWAAGVASRRLRFSEFYTEPCFHTASALDGRGDDRRDVAHRLAWELARGPGQGRLPSPRRSPCLLNRERPSAIWAHLGLLSFVEFTICGLGLAMGSQNLAAHHYGLLFMADGLTMLAAAEVLRFWLNRSEPQTATDQTGGVVNSRWAGTILAAIPRSVDHPDLRGRLAGVPRHRSYLARRAGVFAGISAVIVGDAAGSAANVGLPRAGPARGGHARSRLVRGRLEQPGLAGRLARGHGALLGLALWAAGVASRRLKLSEFYTEPCFRTAFALTVGAYRRGPAGSGPGARSLRARHGRARLERAGHDAAGADMAHGRVDLCRRLPLRHGDLPGPLQRGQERPGDGLCAGPGRGGRGHRALGDRVRLSARPRHVDQRMRPAALSLGRSVDRRWRFYCPIAHPWCSPWWPFPSS